VLKIEADNIIFAIDVANHLRLHFGEDIISDLPPSTPSDTNDCVLANAFNFNCRIDGASGGKWYAMFDANTKFEHAEVLANYLGTELIKGFNFYKTGSDDDDWNHPMHDKIPGCIEEHEVGVLLPEEIAKIAIDFDEGFLNEYVKASDDLLEKTLLEE
jgi:hypothetical protein